MCIIRICVRMDESPIPLTPLPTIQKSSSKARRFRRRSAPDRFHPVFCLAQIQRDESGSGFDEFATILPPPAHGAECLLEPVYCFSLGTSAQRVMFNPCSPCVVEYLGRGESLH